MAIGDRDLWVFRIVHQDTGKPAPGVPVTVLDKAGNAAGHWVSDGDGIVAPSCHPPTAPPGNTLCSSAR